MGDMLLIKLPVIYNNRLSLFSILLRPFVVVVVGFDDVTVLFYTQMRFIAFYICAHHHSSLSFLQTFNEKKSSFLLWPVLHVHRHINTHAHKYRPRDRKKIHTNDLQFARKPNTLQYNEMHECENRPPS